ncbi:hypothetical protein MMC17_009841 [Xylographa soralifera]|nr:hypothetical protein [Xylographa soralifera]
MFSYLNGIRPSTRRAASSQALSQQQLDVNGDRYEKSAHGGERHLNSSSRGYAAFGGLHSRPRTADPPSLPPIPRVASQYGVPDTTTTSSENYERAIREGEQRYGYLVSSRDEDRRSATHRTDHDVSSRQSEAPSDFSSSLPKISQSLQHHWADAVPAGHHEIQTSEARLHGEPNSTLAASRRVIEVADGPNQFSQNYLPPSSSQLQLPSNAVTTQIRHGRPKRNLLNPMSILSRRRSAQTMVQVNDNSYSATRYTTSTGRRLPDDYDPRIRGKVVHDFSAPRSRPYVDPRDKGWAERRPSPYGRSEDIGNGDSVKTSEVQNGSWSQPSLQVSTGESVQNIEKQHTPIFKEQFGEEMEPWRFDIEDRRNQHTTGLLERMKEEDPHDRRSPLPPFARNFPSDVATNLHMQEASFLTPKKTPPLTISDTGVTSSPHSREVAKVTSTPTPPKSRSRAASITDPSFQGADLPKHFKSNASRFSFDLAGVGSSAQEKLLEERHRQKNAPRRHGSMISRVSATMNAVDGLDEEDEEDEFMGEDEEYDGVLEERIPGVNADADDDIGNGFDVITQATILSLPQNTYQANEGAIRLYEDFKHYPCRTLEVPLALGISDVNEHRILVQQAKPTANPISDESAASDLAASQHSTEHINDPSIPTPQKTVYEDDLYFDDGMIDHFDDWDSTTFDESVFDDDTSRIYGLPLRDLKPLPNIVESSSAETSQQSTRPISAENGSKPYHTLANVDSETATNLMLLTNAIPARKTSLINKASTAASFNQSIGLTSGNLAAYHSALASAAESAARDGRFDRKLSIDEGEQEPQNHCAIQKPHVSFDEQKFGQARGLPEPYVTEGNTNDFNFDDEQDDDVIIAAANAEALENDDEGFYGREFGFFAHASGSGEAQYANGGYFGPAGVDGLKRSHSGKANFQEPSLTPITERSEWSQRNSMISLPMQSLYSPSLPTPGLAQLADAMQYEDEDMSLSALLKLRRGAFGGSNVSLVSSGSHKTGSPQSYLPPTPGAALSSALSGSHLIGSSYSLVSNNETGSEIDLHSGSPTLTLQTQGLMMAPPGTLQDKSSGSDSSPKRRNAVKGSGHSRSSSGTESVSYVKELDEDGAGRWVLEKRRTAEGGQIEILGRQVVEGGRI